MDKEKSKKCDGLKCNTCHFYEKSMDFCKEKEIKDCSKKVLTEFSNCESYLVDAKYVMF